MLSPSLAKTIQQNGLIKWPIKDRKWLHFLFCSNVEKVWTKQWDTKKSVVYVKIQFKAPGEREAKFH